MNERGFTLIELAVVVFILGIAALLVLPRLFPDNSAALKRSARTMGTTFRYLQDRAVATRITYDLTFRFPDGTVTVNKVTDAGEVADTGDSTLQQPLLADSVSVEDVALSSLGRVKEGEVSVRIGAAGLQELLTVHLKSQSGVYTVTAYPVSGKVRVEEGYREAVL